MGSIDQELSRENEYSLESSDELGSQINQMFERQDGVWTCKVCGKTGSRKDHMKRHAETHIEGMSHVCNICSKTFKNKNSLDVHVSYIHSNILYSCNICEKSGMIKKAYFNHIQRNHKTQIG